MELGNTQNLQHWMRLYIKCNQVHGLLDMAKLEITLSWAIPVVHSYIGISGQDSRKYTYSDIDTAGPFTYRIHCAVESNCNLWNNNS